MYKSFIFSFFLFAQLSVLSAGPSKPIVVMETSSGVMEIELYPKKAPKTVENFLSYVNSKFYNGTIFHRVIDGFMIQGGGYTDQLKKKGTRSGIENEASNGLSNDVGAIAMARTGDPHSATAQFFINVNNNSSLNHTAPTPQGYGYTVFGRVKKGMTVVNKIKKVTTKRNGPFQNLPMENIVITKAYLKK
jgi:cyclophilin family peptidyl-prolyl cis-trans isomerase